MRALFGKPLAVAAALLLAAVWPAAAQTGTIQGRVTAASTGEPLPAAHVEVRVGNNVQPLTGVLVGAEGRYVVTGLRPGTYTISVKMFGYSDHVEQGVRVTVGSATTVDAALREASVGQLDPLVVTASKKTEKALNAPAQIAVVPIEVVQARPTTTPVDHLRSVPGIDVITQGVQATNVVARGFNNIFSTTLHTLTDYRVASIPSLRANLMHFIPATNEDIERVEVVLGPGAALYGPNTANGVVHFLTRSPLEHTGTVVSAGVGERNVVQSSFRTAHKLSDNFAFKVSGQYMQGDEWEFLDPTEYAARIRALPFDPATKIGLRDFDIQRYAFEGRADWRVTEEFTTVLSAGHTVAASGIELTGVGAGQTQDWTYSFAQARGSYKRWFGQMYMNMSDAGDTYLIRTGMPVSDNSKFFVGQIQHGFGLAEDRYNFTYGADALFTRPDTEGRIHGRNEADDATDEFGAYMQAETELSDRFELITAGRVDYHSRLDGVVFSPRAALVFHPTENQNFRLTYNRAFSTPVSFSLYLDLDAGPVPGIAGDVLGFRIRAMGTEPGGFTFWRPDGTVGIRSPFAEGIGRTDADLLSGDVATLWGLAVSALQNLGRIDAQTAALLSQIKPTDADIGINTLNTSTLKIAPLSRTTVQDVPRIEESLSTTYELGYKGILGERVLLNAALWYDQRTNLMSPLSAVVPFVLLDSTGVHNTVAGALQSRGLPPAMAQQRAAALAQGLKGLPLAVVSSAEVPSTGAEVLASYRNYGELNVYGADLNATAIVNDDWSITGGIALVSDNYFRVAGNFVGLNAAKEKAMGAVNYRNVRNGLNGEIRARYTGEFPVYSAPYNATACIDATFDVPLTGEITPCVAEATLVDVTLGYKLPRFEGASVQLTVQNVLDEPFRSFVGVPEIGRFALLRMRYEF